MPIITSSFSPKGLFKNAHFSTIYSAKLRVSPKVSQQRVRLLLKDNDFLDVDFSYPTKQNHRVAILLHGLEGNAQRTYIQGQANLLLQNQFSVCALNYRGCSGETNVLYKSYNAGKTDDLAFVIQYILKNTPFQEIALVGFSLGGNLLLKFLGEYKNKFPEIKCGVAISSPLQLDASLKMLSKKENILYTTTFLNSLKKKLKAKAKLFPENLSVKQINKINNLKAFDDFYTAPAHGFKNALDYYLKNSSLQFLPEINIPVYILNAQNDTFLSQKCYPFQLAEQHKNIYLETPKYGGHVGFHINNKTYYSELKTVEFLNLNCTKK